MYSLKSCVINFHTQTSSSQSEDRCFLTCLVQSKATAECEFGAEFPAFYRCLQLALHSPPRLASRKCKLLLRRLTFSRSFSRRNVKNISEIGVELSQRCCILITALSVIHNIYQTNKTTFERKKKTILQGNACHTMALYVGKNSITRGFGEKFLPKSNHPYPPPPPPKKSNRRPLRECSVTHNEEQKSCKRVVVEVSFQYNIGLRDQD